MAISNKAALKRVASLSATTSRLTWKTNKNIIEHQMVQHENNGISNNAILTLNSQI